MSSQGWEPFVSVVIPAYNAASYIAETLSSVVQQTYPSFEVLLVDDGSDDGELLLQNIAVFGDRVRCIRQPNGGPSAARNTGIRAAKGELVAFLDSDDMWETTFLSVQAGRFQEDPALDMVWCNCSRLGAANDEKTQFDSYPPQRPVTLESLIRIVNVPVTSTTVAKKDVVVGAGLFDATMRRCEDFDLWLRMAANGARFDFENQVLARRRSRPTSLSADLLGMSNGASIAYSKLERTLDADSPLAALIRSSRANYVAGVQQELAKRSMDEGKWDDAIRCLTEANRMKRTTTRSVFLGIAQVSLPAAKLVAKVWRK